MFKAIFYLSLIFSSFPVLGTSWIKHGKYMASEHRIKCPPLEFVFPIYSKSSGYEVELEVLNLKWCKGRPHYLVKKNDSTARITADLVRSNNGCTLILAYPTYQHPSRNVINSKGEEDSVFRYYQESALALPGLLGFKSLEHDFIEGKDDEDTLPAWCSRLQ
jgi:hypothetical protein